MLTFLYKICIRKRMNCPESIKMILSFILWRSVKTKKVIKQSLCLDVINSKRLKGMFGLSVRYVHFFFRFLYAKDNTHLIETEV